MNTVVLLSGGNGIRMNADLPKQHIVLGGRQIIEYTLTAFSESECVDSILVVSNSEYMEYVTGLISRYPKLKWVTEGGLSRIQSVENAVKFLRNVCKPSDKVIISDAVRPCVTLREIKEILDDLDVHEAVTTGVEIYETVLKVQDSVLSEIIPREGVIRQTSPEGYLYSTLLSLYEDESPEVISKYRNIGIDQLFSKDVQIGLVKSNPLNFKITTQEDLILFETVLEHDFRKIINQG